MAKVVVMAGSAGGKSHLPEPFRCRGEPQQLITTRWNPDIIKAYYFKSLDMTIFVNELTGEVSHWRMGRKME